MQRKFLFVSLEGLIGDTAWTVAKEGHHVKYFIANKEEHQKTKRTRLSHVIAPRWDRSSDSRSS